MLATPPQETLPTPEDFLCSINAEPDRVRGFLATSGATTIYADLEEYIFEQYQELLQVYGEEPFPLSQLKSWKKTRSSKIQRHSRTLADESDLSVSLSVGYQGSSMMYWMFASTYSTILVPLEKQLEALRSKSPDAINTWLADLEHWMNTLVSANEVQVVRLQQESQDDSAQEIMMASLPDPVRADQLEPLMKLVSDSFRQRMEAIVIRFHNQILLDIVARTHDYFVTQPSSNPGIQEGLPPIEVSHDSE